MRAFIAYLLLLFSTAAFAQADGPLPQAVQGAYTGLGADIASSLAASALPGLVEGGAGLISVPIRIGLIEHAKTLPPHEALPVLHAVEAGGKGAAVNNGILVAGVLLGKLAAAATLGPVAGIAVGIYKWNQGYPARERAEFDHMCAKAIAEGYAKTCAYTAPV